MQKNKLIIVQSVNNFSSLEEFFTASADILVFEQSVMIALEEKGIKYKTVEDFYSADQYCQDIHVYHNEVVNLLSKLDEACKRKVGFPHAYSGNELYLSVWLDNLFFLERVIKVIHGKYKKIYLYATHRPKKTPKSQFDFSMLNSYKVNGTISLSIESSPKRIIQLIYNSIELCFIKDAPYVQKNIPFMIRVRHFLNRLQNYIDKTFLTIINKTNKPPRLKNKKVYVIQDGYEVLYLKKYLPKFEYLNPVTQLRQKIEIERPVDLTNISIVNILESFTSNNFYFLEKYICLVVNSYHLEVVGRVNSFKKQFEYLILKDSPNFLLFSIGTRDVFDSICCHVANCHNIPIITFQHGGTSIYHYSAYQKSVEYNQRALKILIAQSRKEAVKMRNKETEVLCMGSIQQYESNQALSNTKPTKDIIFCLGPDVNFSFRSLLNYYSAKKRHQQSIDIIATVEHTSLPIDIKLHPSGEKDSYWNYKDIVKNNQHKNASILYGSFSEVVSKNYKLIIIDFLLSGITKQIFSLEVPVIICNYDFNKMHMANDVSLDLYKRCYVAKNKNELRELLERYKAGKLPSKWSMDFIDKYIYPVDSGNPGDNIAKYIHDITKK